jgi:hypothetical protein
MDTPVGETFGRDLARRLLWALSAVLAFVGLIFAVGIGLLTKSYVVIEIGAAAIIVAVAAAGVALSLRSSRPSH